MAENFIDCPLGGGEAVGRYWTGGQPPAHRIRQTLTDAYWGKNSSDQPAWFIFRADSLAPTNITAYTPYRGGGLYTYTSFLTTYWGIWDGSWWGHSNKPLINLGGWFRGSGFFGNDIRTIQTGVVHNPVTPISSLSDPYLYFHYFANGLIRVTFNGLAYDFPILSPNTILTDFSRVGPIHKAGKSSGTLLGGVRVYWYDTYLEWSNPAPPPPVTETLCPPPHPGGPNCEATDNKSVTEDEVKQVLGSGYYRAGEYPSLFLCSGGSFTINPTPADACDIAGSKCVILHAADGTKYLSRCSDILDKNPRPQDAKPPPEFCFLCWLNGCCNEHSKRLTLPKVSVGTIKAATTTMADVYSAIGLISIPNFQPIAWPAGTKVVIWNPTKKNTFPKVLGKTAA